MKQTLHLAGWHRAMTVSARRDSSRNDSVQTSSLASVQSLAVSNPGSRRVRLVSMTSPSGPASQDWLPDLLGRRTIATKTGTLVDSVMHKTAARARPKVPAASRVGCAIAGCAPKPSSHAQCGAHAPYRPVAKPDGAFAPSGTFRPQAQPLAQSPAPKYCRPGAAPAHRSAGVSPAHRDAGRRSNNATPIRSITVTVQSVAATESPMRPMLIRRRHAASITAGKMPAAPGSQRDTDATKRGPSAGGTRGKANSQSSQSRQPHSGRHEAFNANPS
jgi:hypothetical protein